MHTTLLYLPEETQQRFLGWWFERWTSWTWSGYTNIRKHNLLSEFEHGWKHLFGLLVLPNVAAHRRWTNSKWCEASWSSAMSIIHVWCVLTVLPRIRLKSWTSQDASLWLFLRKSWFALSKFPDFQVILISCSVLVNFPYIWVNCNNSLT